ncbi:hypothetical protein BX666DRAFT_2112590 [Dichotomocladium elegans]|nr:hypothetical protein BX666DRAFT_2112590 [Dichotomocladium elegans]
MRSPEHQHRRQQSIDEISINRHDTQMVNNHRQQQRPSLSPNARSTTQSRRASTSNFLQATSLKHDQQLRRPSAPEYSAPRLSIADQFMSPNYAESSAPASPSGTARIRGNSSTVGSTAQSLRLQNPTPVERPSLSDPDPARLTIAEMFSKTSTQTIKSSSSFHSNNSSSLAQNPSQVQVIHPLEARSTTAITGAPADAFDSHLNLDLTLPVPSNAWDGRRYTRPFGSQETLVHSGGSGSGNAVTVSSLDKVKKDSGDYSMTDYYTDGSSSMTADDDDHHPQKRHPWRNGGEMNDKDGYDEEARLDGSSNDAMEPRGIWIGCCFMSCGQRHHHQPTKDNKSKRRTANTKQLSSAQQNHPKKRTCNRRGWVFFIFIFFILIVVTAYILWPRTPLMRIEGASLIAAPKVTETHQGVMVGNVAFESQWRVNVTVDNRGNKQQQSSDGNQSGGSEDIVLAPNTISTIQLPVWLDYQARDETDITFSNLRKACIPQPPKTHHDAKTNQTVTDQPQRESLQLHFWITLHIFGLDWVGYKPTVIVTPATGGFACPLS